MFWHVHDKLPQMGFTLHMAVKGMLVVQNIDTNQDLFMSVFEINSGGVKYILT